MSDQFWREMAAGYQGEESDMDSFLKGAGGKALGGDFESVRQLTDQHREANALPLPVTAGTRVTFAGSLGAYLSMENPPENGMSGEVVSVRSAGGDITAHEGRVFVKWADGQLRAVSALFLRAATGKKASVPRGVPADPRGRIASSVHSFRVASLGDLTQFFVKAGRESNTLIHKADRDLWNFQKDADGNLLLTRLFDETGEPLKA